jgi:dihydroorotase
VRPEALRSQGKSTPFSGYAMSGAARATLVGGRIVHEHDSRSQATGRAD